MLTGRVCAVVVTAVAVWLALVLVVLVIDMNDFGGCFCSCASEKTIHLGGS